MENNISQKVEQLNKQRKATKRWKRVVAGLAAVVMIATNGALSLPAETTENTTYCGIAEHTHTDACYESSAELVCGREESDGHAHSMGCYSAMLCGQEVSEGHTHGSECYGEKTLSCGREESASHTHVETCNGEAALTCGQDGVEDHSHDDSCYTTPIECGQEVSEGHTHTDACYTAPLTCQLSESEGHAHTLECCDTASLSCGAEEAEEHHHSDECYGEEVSTMACEEEVHTHEKICFSNPNADLETRTSWESAFTSLTLSGNWGQDLVAVAKTQLGYKESNSNYQVEDDGVTTRGYTRYGVWAGDDYMDWSAAFVAFCLHYAEVKGVPSYTGGTASQWRQAMQAAGMTRIGDAQVGDLVFLDDDVDGTTDHVGIVSSTEGGLTIILGDDQNSVRQRTNPNAVAVMALPENPNAPVEETTAPAEETTVPEEETTAPAETTAPEDDTTTPTNPADDVTDPTGESTPEDDATDPTGESTPEDDATDPTGESTPEDDPDCGVGPVSDLITGDCGINGSNVTYELDLENGTLTISGSGDMADYPYYTAAPWNDYAADINTVVVGKDVTSLGTCAFMDHANLTTVIFQEGSNLQSINYAAFSGCMNLENIVIPASVTNIGGNAFNECNKIKITRSGSCGSTLTYSLSTASGDLVISGSGTMPVCYSPSMPWNAFPTQIKTVTITDGVSNIGNWAFYGFSNLTEISIPDSVTSIESGAFSGCTNLTSITLPASASVDIDALKTSCTNLTSLKLSGNCGAVGNEANVTYELDLISGELVISGSGDMADFTGSSSDPWYAYRSDISTVTIKDGVSSVGVSAFNGYSNIETVSLPDSLKRIDDYAFFNCDGLQSITIPDSVTYIGQQAFTDCDNLKTLKLPNQLKSLGVYAFQNCHSLAEVTIPGSLDAISVEVFSRCENLTSVTISEGVTTISGGAFRDCTNLTSISLPSTLTTIQSGAFGNCTSLASVYLPDSVTSLANDAFPETTIVYKKISGSCGESLTYALDPTSKILTISGSGAMKNYGSASNTPWYNYATGIETIVISADAESIGNNAFSGFSSLTSVVFAEGSKLNTIGNNAFDGCSALTEVKLPDNITHIGTNAFQNCTSLTSINIPASLKSLGADVFKGCDKLPLAAGTCGPTAYFILDLTKEELTIFGKGAMSNFGGPGNIPWNSYKDKVKTVVIQEGITHLGQNSFYYHNAVQSVTLPKTGLLSIGSSAFLNATSLNSIELPDTITTIGGSAFQGCSGLTSINIPKALQIIGNTTFRGCTTLQTVTVPEDSELTEIGYYAFRECSKLSAFYVPAGVKTIGECAFYSTNMQTVTFAENSKLETIGPNAFNGTGLTSVTIPKNVTAIGNAAFYKCGSLKSLTFEEGSLLTSIGVSAFNQCDLTGAVVIPEGVQTISDNAFVNNDHITELTIPSTVTIIGNSAFQGNDGMTTVNMPEAFTDAEGNLANATIVKQAFQNCTSLTSIDIPEGVTSIGDNAFSGCTVMKEVTIPSTITSIGNSAFSGNRQLTTVNMPESITYATDENGTPIVSATIGASAFQNCIGLTSIVIPRGITNIGNNAFYNCLALTEVTIPSTVTTIGESAFSTCSALTTVNMPEAFTDADGNIAKATIGAYAFNGCTQLSSINIPEGVTSIGGKAFMNCDKITEITIPSSVTTIGSEIFADCAILKTVTFEDGIQIKDIGTSAFYNCRQLISINIPDGVTSIGNFAFYNCSISEIKIADSVETIGPSAFHSCKALTSIEIPKNVTSIGDHAFENCTSLNELTLNASALTSVDPTAFSGCTALKTLIIGSNVDILSGAFVNSLPISKIAFQVPNYFTLDAALALDALDLPLSTLAADNYYVDEYGVLYALDSETMTAALVYFPDGLARYSVPAAIPSEDSSGMYTVTTIAEDAAGHAKALTQVTFPEDAAITVERFAFTGSGLTSVNGLNTLSQIKAALENMTFEDGAFFKTGILDDEQEATKDDISLTEGSVTVKLSTGTGSDGDHTFLTGEDVITRFIITSDETAYVRIYVTFDADDDNHYIQYGPGEYTIEGEPCTVFKVTNVENTYCLEFLRDSGRTLDSSFTTSYLNGVSDGGEAWIYAVILTPEEQAALGKNAPAPTNCHHIVWGIHQDSYILTGVSYDVAGFAPDSNNPAIIHPSSNKLVDFYLKPDAVTSQEKGNDNVPYIEHTADITFPKGIVWADGILDAYRAGNVSISPSDMQITLKALIGENKYTFLYLFVTGLSNDISEGAITYELTETGISIKWISRNSNAPKDDFSQLSVRYQLYGTNHETHYTSIQLDPNANIEPGQQFDITCKLSEKIHYTFSNEVLEVEEYAHMYLSTGAFDVDIDTVEPAVDSLHAGEAYPIQIKVANLSAAPTHIKSLLEDHPFQFQIPATFYMSGSDLTEAFQSVKSDHLTVTISNARFCAQSGAKVTDDNGNQHIIHADQMGANVTYDCGNGVCACTNNTGTITITMVKPEEGADSETAPAMVVISNGSEEKIVSPAGIQGVLDGWGFNVGPNTTYTMDWDFDMLALRGKEEFYLNVPLHAKDSFMRVESWSRYFIDGNYPYFGEHTFDEPFSRDCLLFSYVWSDKDGIMLNSKGEKVAAVSDAKKVGADSPNPTFPYVWRDFTILMQAGVIRAGEIVSDPQYVSAGEVMQFSPIATHRGDATYDVVPLVFQLGGDQVLLVPTEGNQKLSEAEPLEILNQYYYKLDQDGTYKNVTIGGMLADRIVVENGSTIIYWYVTDWNAGGTVTVNPTIYTQLVDLDGKAGIFIDNDIYVNDHVDHRIWDHGTFDGSIPTPEKHVVTALNGESPEDDTVEDLYRVGSGESITYRLTLVSRADPDTEIYVQGNQIWDVLPLTVQDAAWSKDNVTIIYDSSATVSCSDGTEWAIDGYSKMEAGQTDQAHQLLRWRDDFTISFKDKAYIYVTLSFPEDDPQVEGDAWDQFVQLHGTSTIENVFHLYSFEDEAYLDLAIPTEALIEKGVLHTGTKISGNYTWANSQNMDKALFHYNNPGAYTYYTPNSVTYFASIYNDGYGRMYIDSIQDVLPKGFSFNGLVSLTYLNQNPTVTDDAGRDSKAIVNVQLANYLTAEVNTTSDGRERVTFQIAGDQTILDPLGLKYDSELDMYYLMPGVQLWFVYECTVGEYAETDVPNNPEDPATNRLTVSIYDYNGAGVTVGGSTIKSLVRNGTVPNDSVDPNDPTKSCYIAGRDGNVTTLAAEVTVTKDPIQPGIQKTVDKITSGSGSISQSKEIAAGTDLITWKLDITNDSYQGINGYTITDVMTAPYVFTGEVTYKLYNPNGSTTYTDYHLFTITDRQIDSDGKEFISVIQTYGNTSYSIEVGGEAVEIKVASSRYVYARICKDDAGNEVLSIYFPPNSDDGKNTTMTLNWKSKAELWVTTKNGSNNHKNTVYYNGAYFTTSEQQPFEKSNVPVGKGEFIDNYTVPGTDSTLPAVYDDAFVTVTTGHATVSYKGVTESGNPDNSVTSVGKANSISISDPGATFRYELTVQGTQDLLMEKFVIIDNLPQEEDHLTLSADRPRHSGFQVDLDDSPDFEVIVTTPDGKETTLDSSAYTISFSASSGPFSDEDWAGTTAWTAKQADARSIRLVIHNEDGSVIPVGSSITLRFDAKVSTNTNAADLYGKTAWNSFGYSYEAGNATYQSAPEKVGVQFPSVPKLTKLLADKDGTAQPSTTDETFRFLIYAGDAIDLSNATTDTAIANALGTTVYAIAEVTIPAGSRSEDISLGGLKQYSFNDGWVATDADWIWTDGSQYTFLELPTSSDSLYTFTSIGGNRTNSYTLTYDGSSSQTITAVNSRNTWTLQVNKLSTTGTKLESAWFGLYSPNSDNAMSKAEVKDAGLDKDPALTYTVTDETTGEETIYYLMAISASDADGILRWTDLQEDLYYVCELQAPAGYHRNGEAIAVTREYEGTFPAQRAITVYNDFGYIIPEAGGEGTYLYTLGGALMMTAALLWYSKISRRKEDWESS